MWVYDSHFVIISRKEVQVKFVNSYPSSEKEKLDGLVVECLTGDQVVAGSSLTGGTAFCP